MRKIKEIDPEYRVDWYRTPIDPEKLSELNERNDLKGFLQAGSHLGLLILTAALSVRFWRNEQWGWMSLFLFGYLTVTPFAINAVHELVHGTVFKTRRLNTIFAAVFSLHGWINHFAFWASHSEHHKFTLHDPEDSEVIVPITLEWKQVLQRLTLDFPRLKWHLKNTLQLALGRPVGEWGEHLYATRDRRFKIYGWARFQLAFHGILLTVSLFNGWWIVPVLQFAPLFTGGWLQFFLNETQHVGLQDHVNDFRLNSRTFHTNPFFRLLYWQMNYHIEHHMYAGVPCYNLHRLHKEIQYELPYTFNGLVETWHHILYCLYRQKTQPGYVYIPEIPGGEQPREAGVTDFRLEKTVSAVAKPAEKVDDGGVPFKAWECTVCGFIYDEESGLPEEGIAPGTRWEDIPEDWRCPDCGVAKADFTMKEIKRPAASAVPVTVEIGNPAPVVILGAGIAGYSVAREFRKLNRKKEVIILTRDSGEVYSKPSLSNALQRKQEPEMLVHQTAGEFADEWNLTVRTHQEVKKIDPASRKIVLAEEEISYSRLVLALGADPNPLPFPGVLQVNDLKDYRVFRSRLPERGNVLIIGAGLIGCEFANDLITNGFGVGVVEMMERPLARLADAGQSEGLMKALAEKGVRWHFNENVREVIDGKRLILESGKELEGDVVLAAAGLKPRCGLAAAAGIRTGRGIRVDETLKTSADEVYAIGDCAEYREGMLPYIRPVQIAAPALARTLSGTETEVEFPEMPVVVKTPAYPLTVPGFIRGVPDGKLPKPVS